MYWKFVFHSILQIHTALGLKKNNKVITSLLLFSFSQNTNIYHYSIPQSCFQGTSMAESDGRHRRREPLPVSSEEDAANASWRLNVEEFRLPNQTHDHHQQHRSFTFRGLLRKPSESFSFPFYCFCMLMCLGVQAQ